MTMIPFGNDFHSDYNNVLQVGMISRSIPQDIYREVLDKGTRFRKAARGYGIGSGNSIPEYVPVEGFIAMVDAVREIRRRDESQ